MGNDLTMPPAPADTIRYCPKCAAGILHWQTPLNFECGACGFMLYLNVAAAVAVIIECRGKILFGVRKNEPGRGMLDLPGGFVDAGESADECARREVQEETGIVLGQLQYLSSFPNTYLFRDVLYNTLDIILVSTLEDMPAACAGDDLADLVWVQDDAVDYDRIAFPSLRKAVRLFLASRR